MFGSRLSDSDKRSAFYWAVGGVLVCTWLYGSWHGLNEHGWRSAIAGFLIPPYGLYLANEAWYGHQPQQTFELSSPAGQQLAFAQFNNQCLLNEESRKRSGLNDVQYEELCRCVAYAVLEILQTVPEAMNDDKVLQHHSRLAEQSCYSSAQYLGAGRMSR